MILHGLDRFRDAGLLILRVGLGVMFILHGYGKLAGGPEVWAGVGAALGYFGITFAPAFWGFMAGLSEFGGGSLLILGLLTRPAAFFLLCVMVVATNMHLNQGDPFTTYSHPIEDGIVFLSLILVGPGKFSLDEWLSRRIRRKP